MVRRRANVDGNQTTIVRVLRDVGASVVSVAGQHGGCPDLLVGYRGRNYLLEVKDGRKPPSRWALKPLQVEFHQLWNGHVATVLNPSEALAAIGAIEGPSVPRGTRTAPVVGGRQQI